MSGSTEPGATVSTWKGFKGKDPIWCPGCGDFGVLRALQSAVAGLGLAPHETVLVTGIGCSGTVTANFRSFGFHGVHGRALPVATGIKLAHPGLTVLVAGGDGDGYGIGLGHFLHAARRNVDITYIVMDNQVYGLTKGQTSPTTAADMATKASPLGPMAEPLRPLELALAGGASFIAQAFAGDLKQTQAILTQAIKHPGFALVNIQSPCVTYNLLNTYDWFRAHGHDLAEAGHDPTDREAAYRVARDGERVPFGIVYRTKRAVFAAGRGDAARRAGMDPANALARSATAVQDWHDAFRVR